MQKHSKQCIQGEHCKQCRRCRQCKRYKRCEQFTRQCYSISAGLFSIIVCIIIMTTTIIPPLNRSASWLQTSRRSTALLRTILNQSGFTFTFKNVFSAAFTWLSKNPNQNIFSLACLHFERPPNPKFCFQGKHCSISSIGSKYIANLTSTFYLLKIVPHFFNVQHFGSTVAPTRTFDATFLFRTIKL